MPLKESSVSKVISRVVFSPASGEIGEGGEETEIAAQIFVPKDGGWGWVVVIASFTSIFIIDGISFTFGALLGDIARDFKLANSLAAIVNATQSALYYIVSPLTSALINRFGFRACIMTGSIISSFSLLASYFTSNYAALIVFYGVLNAFGCSLINMSAHLVVGFYFERLRAIALSVTTIGSSCGVMIMFPINTLLVKLTDWRSTTLFHSGLLGTIFFLGLTYRPLLSLTVMKTEEEEENPTRTVTFLPNLAEESADRQPGGPHANTAERWFKAVSNAHFPTAMAVIEEESAQADSLNKPSTSADHGTSKITLIAHTHGGISRQQLKQVQSIVSRSNMQSKIKTHIEVLGTEVQKPKKQSCCGRCCQWEGHTDDARPIYRDDVFYEGKLEKLPTYQKSVRGTSPEERTGLEYQLAVSRTITINDLREKRGVCTTALRRALASMMDPTLLRRTSFLFICTSGFLAHVGQLVPYIFLSDRNSQAGIDVTHCSFFVSVIGLTNAIGRLMFGTLANYIAVDPLKMMGFSIMAAGVSTITSTLSYNLYYQYFYCSAFGIFMSASSSLRSISLVSIYGLDKLTNAMGIVLMFLGLGNLFSTPTASVLKEQFGYSTSFYVSGSFIALSGIIMLFVRMIVTKEEKKAAKLKETKRNIQKEPK